MIDYNNRARRVYERLGFKQEGILRESQCVDGKWYDAVLFGILATGLDRSNT